MSPLARRDISSNEILAPLMHSSYAALHLEILTVGIQLALCTYGLAVFNSTSGSLRRQRLPYVVVSFIILALFSVSYVTDSIVLANLLINGSRDFGDISAFLPWYALLGSLSNLLVNFIGDGVLIYRCYVIWTTHRWLLALPIIAYIASFSFAIVSVVSVYVPVPVRFPSAWIALSVFVNVCVTLMISSRIFQTRRRLAKVFSEFYLAKYTGVMAILIESALPFSVFGIVGAAFYTNANLSGLPAAWAITSAWYCLSALCPQLIIFRVLVGSSFADDLRELSKLLEPIAFARGDSKPDTLDESCPSDTVSGREQNTSSRFTS